ncbi:MAG: chloride channel protein [Cyanobacteriota bacterium]|nr:chloride channel protein [Cyanobacteriota bacterium]
MSPLKRLKTWFHNRHFGQQSTEIYYALAEACLIGFVSALAALLLKQGIGLLGTIRLSLAQEYGSITLALFGLTFGFFAGGIIEIFSPAAAGSGIPQVKAVLAQFPLPLSLRVAIVKTIGTILVLASGLAIGRRGPTVHIGAALAAQLSQWVPTSPQHRRQMIAAGAAAGLAAGFNTPIAGVLFVVEELSRDMSSLTLETTILASFTGSVVSRLLGSADFNIPGEILVASAQNEFNPEEIPFYILLGILAGLLGTFFQQSILASLKFYRRLNLPMACRVGLAGLISGIVVATTSPIFRNNAGLREFFLLGEITWQQTAFAFPIYFGLILVAYGSGAPGGLFSPALVLGSALGYLVGSGAATVSSNASPATFALVGMAAFFSSVARVPVTAIVIIFEMTAAFNLVLPLMIGSAIAYLVASTLTRGSLYERLLEVGGIELKDEATPNDLLSGLTAADVMQRRVDTVLAQMSLDEAFQVFADAHHEGFPALDEGRLVGTITVTEANLAKRRGQPGETLVAEVMTRNPVTVGASAPLSDVLYLMKRYQLTHLPVTEGNKLIGIITRTDIIRTEADRLNPSGSQTRAKVVSSYAVYQTRSPAVGRGRILLPLANPDNALALVKMGAAIAREYNYELECLRIIRLPKHCPPDRTPVDTRSSRRLLRRAEKLARSWEVPFHCQIRVSQSSSQAILETLEERHINLLLMGWKGSTATPGRIFGNTVDILIRQASCDVVLVKLGSSARAYPNNDNCPTNWIVPMAGGPNVERAIQLLPAFKRLTRSPRIWLCRVSAPHSPIAEMSDLERAAAEIARNIGVRAMPIAIRSQSVCEAIVGLSATEDCDVVMLGASREGLLQQAVRGNIPEAIAAGVDCTAILVRGALD